MISQKGDRFLHGRRLRKHGQRRVHHFAYGVLDDFRQRLRGLQLQFRRQIGFDTVDEYLRQLGKNRPDTLGRFLGQHLRRIHGHARTNRSNQACNVVLLAHRMLSELPADADR